MVSDPIQDQDTAKPPSPACPICQPSPRADTAIQERPEPACSPPHPGSFGAGTRGGLHCGGLAKGGLVPLGHGGPPSGLQGGSQVLCRPRPLLSQACLSPPGTRGMEKRLRHRGNRERQTAMETPEDLRAGCSTRAGMNWAVMAWSELGWAGLGWA